MGIQRLRDILIMSVISLAPVTAQTAKEEPKDFLIVVSNSADKAENDKVLADVKKTFEDAGIYYEESSRQYYVYIERYYSKGGAEHAVWWLKKEHKELPKVWAKEVTAGAR